MLLLRLISVAKVQQASRAREPGDVVILVHDMNIALCCFDSGFGSFGVCVAVAAAHDSLAKLNWPSTAQLE